jgi:hypothetical protein
MKKPICRLRRWVCVDQRVESYPTDATSGARQAHNQVWTVGIVVGRLMERER